MLFKAPRGTHDVLPSEVERWHYIEEVIRKICQEYGYGEIRTPLFEQTELFARGVGESTDIVGKEMYSFKDRGQRSMTLRPECTASVVRAFLEHKLFNDAQPSKFYYQGPMFRYDRPQAGRYRQFHQFGVEAFGSGSPALDVEVLALCDDFFTRLGLHDLRLEINSVGCPLCRSAYSKILMEYCRDRLSEFCTDCRVRYEHNPLRILDCKSEKCAGLVEAAPFLAKSLCDECSEHFDRVLELLNCLDLKFHLNYKLVRGLDYYTKTAFEFMLPEFGSQGSLGGGGRYDNLVETCGGAPTPGVGMAIGIERVILAIEKTDFDFAALRPKKIYVALAGKDMIKEGLLLLQDLRENGVSSDMDFLGRSLKGQMRFADRSGFSFVLILGEQELKEGVVTVREMKSGQQEEILRREIVPQIKARIL